MCKLLFVAALALLFGLAQPLPAQVVAGDAYLVHPIIAVPPQACISQAVSLINTGQVGSPIDAPTNHGTVCADIYVFDANQEMLECCSCPITANGLAGNNLCNLTANSLTGVPVFSGLLKIVADNPGGATCDPTAINAPVNSALRGWRESFNLATGDIISESSFQAAPLTVQEQQFLGQACAFVRYLGSGRGRCLCPSQT